MSPGATNATAPPPQPSGRTVRWVVPAYNEEASIADLIDRMAEVSIEQGWRVTAVVVLGERLTPAQWIGVLVIIWGVALVALGS